MAQITDIVPIDDIVKGSTFSREVNFYIDNVLQTDITTAQVHWEVYNMDIKGGELITTHKERLASGESLEEENNAESSNVRTVYIHREVFLGEAFNDVKNILIVIYVTINQVTTLRRFSCRLLNVTESK